MRQQQAADTLCDPQASETTMINAVIPALRYRAAALPLRRIVSTAIAVANASDWQDERRWLAA